MKKLSLSYQDFYIIFNLKQTFNSIMYIYEFFFIHIKYL